MAKSPSLIALLGLLAVAGYQNRDKIGTWLDGMRGGREPGPTPGGPDASGGGSFMDSLGGLFGSSGSGGAQAGLGGALSDLIDSFAGRGRGDVARSWVGPGPNGDTSPQEIEEALGSDVVDHLTKRTGLSRAELLERLSSVLPAAVDGLTPDGRIPAGGETDRPFAPA